jgi:hypothetical protein
MFLVSFNFIFDVPYKYATCDFNDVILVLLKFNVQLFKPHQKCACFLRNYLKEICWGLTITMH